MGDWADRRAKHICGQFDEFKGCEGIIADELRLARRWALEEARIAVIALTDSNPIDVWDSGFNDGLRSADYAIDALKDKT